MKDVVKKLPIGIENFEKIRTEGFYYVDKTGLIKELLQNWGEVNLFTRPRRFGKSLNMSMLKYFFEIGSDKSLFDGLAISKEEALCRDYMGKFPVISVSFKGANGDNFATARAMMSSIIETEAMRFDFLLESNVLSEQEKRRYEQLIYVEEPGKEPYVMSDATLAGSLKLLSQLLCKHYGQKVVILIDEYDVPLAKAFDMGYYDQMINLLRNMFGEALKTNDSLQFAVLTGCLRVSKESIFTGLNNLRVLSVTSVLFDEHFGFTDDEVKELLNAYGLSESYQVVKDWYDGYHFGNVDIYCPWDVICYCDELRADELAQPKNYWINTSGNDAVRHFIQMADGESVKREIERLIEGEAVRKEIYEELTYRDLYTSPENIWSVLFTTGYLTQMGRPEGREYQLMIPNAEIRDIFKSQIMEWFKEKVRGDGEALQLFCQALQNGDADSVEKQFTAYLKKTISIRDTYVHKGRKENFYHGILLGLLGFKSDWAVMSNRESGEGYSDILIEIGDEEIGIVIEVKYPDNANLEEGCRKALDQIETKNYEEQLRDEGMKTILKYGIACYKKRCRVACEKKIEER